MTETNDSDTATCDGKRAMPQAEHGWLQRLVGEWVAEGGMTPDTGAWTETVRSIGGLWIVAEGRGEMLGGTATTIMTLGYDPAKGKYVGSWLGSMMTHLWVYEGEVDASGTTLTLDTVGPDFTDPGKTQRYRDIIIFDDEDTRRLTGNLLGEDGTWSEFMSVRWVRRR